jgi:predicted DCC family thiol-disulfide oxidoreductase YuxK
VSGAASVAIRRRPEAGRAGLGLDEPVVLYDGWCNLCDSSVALLLRLDRRARLRFAALQSTAGEALRHRYPADDRLEETLVLVYQGRCRGRSDAVLTILGLLPPPWRWLTVLTIVPRRVRDRAYELIARHRTKWFGRKQVCMTSLPAERDRFLI